MITNILKSTLNRTNSTEILNKILANKNNNKTLEQIEHEL